jgi:hypothetical protein
VSIVLISEDGARTVVDARLQLELASGDSRTTTYNVSIPSSLADGIYTVQAEAETGDREYNDKNNSAKAPVKIRVARLQK